MSSQHTFIGILDKGIGGRETWPKTYLFSSHASLHPSSQLEYIGVWCVWGAMGWEREDDIWQSGMANIKSTHNLIWSDQAVVSPCL